MRYDLSILIPARNEEFLSRTVDDIFEHRRGKTEVIVILDGAWSDPPLKDYPDLTILYLNQSIGQRAATNQGARLANARYILKLDAHCILSEGFDTVLVETGDKLGKDVVQIPVLYNLHAFDIVCTNCGDRHYQGPIEDFKICDKCGANRKREMVWKPRLNRQSICYRFDTDMHFQYANSFKKRPEIIKGIITGYKLSFNVQSVSSEIIDLFTNLAGSHTFFMNTDESGWGKHMSVNAVCFSPINSSGGIRAIEILTIGNKFKVQGITAGSVFTHVINDGDIFSSLSGNFSNQPSVDKTMNHFVLSKISDIPITVSINASSPVPTSSCFINSNIIKEVNDIFGRKFIYNEKAESFHNGSVTLIPIYDNGLVETMSAQGSCFIVSTEKYWEWNICDEKHGSWGGQGTEVACCAWLCGSRLVTNRKCWYSHLFRTQGKSFGFPYPQDGKQVQKARDYSKDLWLNNKHPKQVRSLAWLIKRFYPLNNGEKDGVPDWHDGTVQSKKVLDYVNKKGVEFVKNRKFVLHHK